MKLLISTLLLTVLFAVSAMAQRFDTIPGDPGPGLALSGTQTAPASLNNSIFEGNTFMFTSTDRSSNYALSLSLDYVSNPEEVQSYNAVGGNWTLSIYRNGVMVGTIYGEVAGGGIDEIMDENGVEVAQRTVDVLFRTQGGTGEFAGTEAQDEPSGSLNVATEGNISAASGWLHNVL